MVALFYHEKVGSNSPQGVGSPVLLDAFSRITFSLIAYGSKVSLEKVIQRIFLVYTNMAHCLHPNYMDKHEDRKPEKCSKRK